MTTPAKSVEQQLAEIRRGRARLQQMRRETDAGSDLSDIAVELAELDEMEDELLDRRDDDHDDFDRDCSDEDPWWSEEYDRIADLREQEEYEAACRADEAASYGPSDDVTSVEVEPKSRRWSLAGALSGIRARFRWF